MPLWRLTGPAVAHLASVLRCKPEGSIPDAVIGIFHWHNPSGRTMADCHEIWEPQPSGTLRDCFASYDVLQYSYAELDSCETTKRR